MSSRKKDVSSVPQPRRRMRTIGGWIYSNAFGISLSVTVFMALPFLQMVAGGKKDKVAVNEVTISDQPPPPPEFEETPPEPPPEDEPPPPPPSEAPLSLDSLSMSLNPGTSGGGAKVFNDALANAMQDRAGGLMAMGGAVTEPKPVYRVPPKIPMSVKRQGISGVIKIECVVDVNGKVVRPRIVGGSPHPAVDAPTIAAVKKWRFEPGLRDGAKAPFKVRIPIRIGV